MLQTCNPVRHEGYCPTPTKRDHMHGCRKLLSRPGPASNFQRGRGGVDSEEQSRSQVFQALGAVPQPVKMELLHESCIAIIVEDAKVVWRTVAAIVARVSVCLYVPAEVPGIAEVQLKKNKKK